MNLPIRSTDMLPSLLLLLSLTVCPVSFAQSASGAGPTGESPRLDAHVIYQPTRYMLGAGDIINVQVSQEPEYSQENVLIGPDGHVSLTEIGDLDVKGHSIEYVTAEITSRLKTVIVDPKVSITLVRTRPCMVYLAGAVMQPGMMQMLTSNHDTKIYESSASAPVSRTDTRLTNVLSNAGGVQPDADLSRVRIKHEGSGETMTVNLWKVLKEGRMDQDPVLRSGDSVFIPHAENMALSDEEYSILLRASIGPKEFPIRVLGEVEKPGVYKLDANSPYLNSALAMAGGYTQNADRGVVAVRRFSDENHFSTFFVDETKLDVVLRPNDVLFIAESRVAKTGRIGNHIARALSPLQSVGSMGSYGSQIFGFGGWRRRF